MRLPLFALARPISFSRCDCIRALLHERHESFHLQNKRGGRAPTGASIHYPRHTSRRYRLKMLRARKRPQRGPLASRRSTAALATQINAMAQPRPRFARNRMRRRYLRFESRLQRCTSRAGHSAGRSMPKPPGSGVTKPARRNRTRSVSRPSPVDVPHMRAIIPDLTNFSGVIILLSEIQGAPYGPRQNDKTTYKSTV
jgi:hypothetical protein